LQGFSLLWSSKSRWHESSSGFLLTPVLNLFGILLSPCRMRCAYPAYATFLWATIESARFIHESVSSELVEEPRFDKLSMNGTLGLVLV